VSRSRHLANRNKLQSSILTFSVSFFAVKTCFTPNDFTKVVNVSCRIPQGDADTGSATNSTPIVMHSSYARIHTLVDYMEIGVLSMRGTPSMQRLMSPIFWTTNVIKVVGFKEGIGGRRMTCTTMFAFKLWGHSM